jgi:hypothetical protein
MYNTFTMNSYEEGGTFLFRYHVKQVLSWNNRNQNYIHSITVNVDLKKPNLMYISYLVLTMKHVIKRADVTFSCAFTCT